MPTMPSNIKCSHLGCKDNRSKYNTFCMDHGGRNSYNNDDGRTEFNSMYQSSHWRQVRISVLSRQPLCQACLCSGRVTAATHVDHVFAWKKIGKAAFYRNLFQSLCLNCHSVKTAHEQRGKYIHYTDAGPIEYVKTDWASIMHQDGEET